MQDRKFYAARQRSEEGKSPEDPEWPIAGLMHRGRDSQASSVADKGDLKIRGMIDLRLAFCRFSVDFLLTSN